MVSLTIYERRDNTDIAALGDAAFELCRACKKLEGVETAKFYWYSTDTVVIWVEGENTDPFAAEFQNNPETTLAAYKMGELAKIHLMWRLMDPAAGQASYKTAGY